MCKCALERDHIVDVLVKCYNIVIKRNHYPRRWLKVVDVTLEKGKVPHLKKVDDIRNDRSRCIISHENVCRI